MSPQQWQDELERRQVERREQHLHDCLKRYERLVENDTNNQSHDNGTTSAKMAALHDLVAAYEALEDWDKALTIEQVLLQEYEDSSQQNNNAQDRAACLYRQGKLYMRQEDWVRASRFLRQALELYNNEAERLSRETANAVVVPCDETIRLHVNMAHVMISMAGVAFYRDRLMEALDWLHQTEELVRPTTTDETTKAADQRHDPIVRHLVLIKCWQHQGLVYRSMDDYRAAWDKYRCALDWLESIPRSKDATDDQQDEEDEEEEVKFWKEEYPQIKQSLQLDLADMLSALDQHTEALDLYQAILQTAEEKLQQLQQPDNNDHETENDAALLASMEFQLLRGVLYHNIGKLYAAMASAESKQKDNSKSNSTNSNNNHSLYITRALDYLTQSRVLKEQWMGDTHPELAKTLNSLGAVHAIRANDNDNGDTVEDADHHRVQALKCFQHALLIARMKAMATATSRPRNSHQSGHENDDFYHIGGQEEDAEVMLALRNIAVLKGEHVPRWGEKKDDGSV